MSEHVAPPESPGWYADAAGAWWYWDGATWTPAVLAGPPAAADGSGKSEKGEALIVWVLALVIGFLGPLIMYFMSREKRFVRHHAAESLNVAIVLTPLSIIALVMVIAGLIAGVPEDSTEPIELTGMFWAGVGLSVVSSLASLVLNVIGLMRASQGKWARVPLPFHPVRGVVRPGEEPYSVT
jgi:uncharacterized Tic20 family protein